MIKSQAITAEQRVCSWGSVSLGLVAKLLGGHSFGELLDHMGLPVCYPVLKGLAVAMSLSLRSGRPSGRVSSYVMKVIAASGFLMLMIVAQTARPWHCRDRTSLNG